ncbi:hypothetical protein CMV30_14900 [Nibricoccus aquaticus]|uniref:Uncharacterized protein n=1 Tax=Nibricoccus aquaticus TaxID=2576891 RepID=A0A290QII0_9BACT|nr:hypothetical protein CMV30_14900 [Nibricoccus aquaticus]
MPPTTSTFSTRIKPKLTAPHDFQVAMSSPAPGIFPSGFWPPSSAPILFILLILSKKLCP